MTTSLPDLLAGVPSLDNPAEPFSYAVEGAAIVGRWDIVLHGPQATPFEEKHPAPIGTVR